MSRIEPKEQDDLEMFQTICQCSKKNGTSAHIALATALTEFHKKELATLLLSLDDESYRSFSKHPEKTRTRTQLASSFHFSALHTWALLRDMVIIRSRGYSTFEEKTKELHLIATWLEDEFFEFHEAEIFPDRDFDFPKHFIDPDSSNECSSTSHCEAFRSAWLLFRSGRLFGSGSLEHKENIEQISPFVAAILGGDLSDGNGYTVESDYSYALKQISTNQFSTPYERSLCGCISGEYESAISLCKSAHDILWLRIRQIIQVLGIADEKEQEVAMQQLKCGNISAIFSAIHNSNSKTIRHESNTIFQLTQEYFIMDDIKGLIEQLAKKLPKEITELRFAVLVVLFILTAPISDNLKNAIEGDCEKILLAYILFLGSSGQGEFIATYCAHLPPTSRSRCYADYLLALDRGHASADVRFAALARAEAVGLNIIEITTLVSDAIMRETRLSTETVTDSMLLRRCRCVEWLCYDHNLRVQALQLCNIVASDLILIDRFDLVQELIGGINNDSSILPNDSLEIIRNCKTPFPEAIISLENSIQEYESLTLFMRACSFYDEWDKHIHKEPELPPEPDSSSYSDHVAYTKELGKLKLEHDEWTKKEEDLRLKVEKFALCAVTKTNFLCDTFPQTTETNRTDVLRELRKKCYPELLFRLFSLYKYSPDNFKCISLINLLADERVGIANYFTPEQLRELLLVQRTIFKQNSNYFVNS